MGKGAARFMLNRINKNNKESLQDSLTEYQKKHIEYFSRSTHGRRPELEIMLGFDNDTGNLIGGIEIESGDENVIVVFDKKEISIHVESDDEEKSGQYELNPDCEHLFLADLANAAWENDFESLFSRFYEEVA